METPAADARILAEGGRRPSLYARYRFFAAGRVPEGHPEWTRRHSQLRRWMTVQLVHQVWCLALFVAVVRFRTGAWDETRTTLYAAAFVLCTIFPFRAVARHRRIVRALAPPRSDEVLATIGERVPRAPGAGLPPLR